MAISLYHKNKQRKKNTMKIDFSDVIGNDCCNTIKLIHHLNEKKICNQINTVMIVNPMRI